MDGNFRIGEWLVDRQLGHVVCQGGSTRLKPMVLRLLNYLADHPGEVVSKKQIIEAVWEGAHVTDDALTHSISELRKAFGDDARNPRIIATIPKRGYRLIATVALEDEVRALERKSLRMAVLPFENLSSDPEQEHFANGLTDMLITDLAKLGPLRVISQTSVMGYNRPRKLLPEIARELHVELLVEGTVVRSGDRVRITVRLLNAADEHLWAEIYEKELTDILTIQSDVAASIVKEIRNNHIQGA